MIPVALRIALALATTIALPLAAGAAATGAASAAVERGSFAGAVESEHPAWFKESFLELEEDIAEAAAAGKRLMLYFWQRGCPYCNALIENNFGDPQIGRQVREGFDVVAINLWGDREVIQVGGRVFTEKTLAEALRVSYTPTLLFFDEQRNVVLRLDGYHPPDSFVLALAYAAPGTRRDGSFRDFLTARRTAPAADELRGEPFFTAPPFNLDRRGGPGGRPIAVYFEEGQCRQCDVLHDRILADQRTRALAERFESVQLDMWSATPVTTPDGSATTARRWAEKLGIVYAPTIVLFDRAGGEVIRIDSFLKTFHVQSVLDYVASGAYREQPSFQRFMSTRADRLRDEGIDVDIFDY